MFKESNPFQIETRQEYDKDTATTGLPSNPIGIVIYTKNIIQQNHEAQVGGRHRDVRELKKKIWKVRDRKEKKKK